MIEAEVFRLAEPDEAEQIVALVNSAYRGDSSRAGWTTEADLLGGQRTDVEEITELLAQPDHAILLYLQGGEMVGSVHLAQRDEALAYLGMLVIQPVLQAQGLGRRLLAEAERYVREAWQVARLQMQVITLRSELIAYYERCGYVRTGETRPFPYGDVRFGLPRVTGLEFAVLEKQFREEGLRASEAMG